MVECANCKEDFSKYMTVEVDLDTFQMLKNKVDNVDQVRICENCYEELSDTFGDNTSDHTHPYLRDDTQD